MGWLLGGSVPRWRRRAEEDGWLEFSVVDHGPGFDLRSVERGSGLRNLADRIEAWGQPQRALVRSDVVGQQLP
ncbi:hypothetical protein BH23ACT1_BH23ACT1_13820 [soil metagenome]